MVITSVTLAPRHFFGVAGRIKDNLAWLDDDTAIYVAGLNIILTTVSDGQQRFLHVSTSGGREAGAEEEAGAGKSTGGAGGTHGFTAMALAPNKRFVAVAEKNERAVASVYDLRTMRKRKNLRCNDIKAKEFVALSFSQESTVLLTMGGAPDWTLICWNWAKGKPIAMTQVVASSLDAGSSQVLSPVSGASFGPMDSSLCLAYGRDAFRFYRVMDTGGGGGGAGQQGQQHGGGGGGGGEIRTLPPARLPSGCSKGMTSHCWLKAPQDHVVMGTEKGELLLISAGTFLAVLEDSPSDGACISCLAALQGGFVAASPEAVFRYYAYHDYESNNAATITSSSSSNHSLTTSIGASGTGAGKGTSGSSAGPAPPASRMFTLAHQWKIESGVPPSVVVTSMSFNAAESLMIAITSHHQAYCLSLSTASPSPTSVKNEDMRHLSSPFHWPQPITGMSVCARKPIVVTCGADRTVRVWNYVDKRMELCKAFPEDVLSVALHPSGLHMTVGFSDKLRIMNILMDDIRAFKELPVKACRECQFSNGGHLLAAVNGTTISLYDFYSGEKRCDLRAHNGKVRSLFWGEGDATLVSCGQDGAVYLWDVDEGKRVGEFNQKGVAYTSAVLSGGSGLDHHHHLSSILAVGSDAIIKELEMPELAVAKEIETGLQVNNIAISHSNTVVYATTAEEGRPGCLRAYDLPLSGEFQDFPCMGAKVTKLCVSSDDKMVLVADEDGSLCIFDVKASEVLASAAAVAMGRGPSGRGGGLASAAGGAGGGGVGGLMAWSEEILVTRTDLDEKNQMMVELKSKVDELTLTNEYNLRLKDMGYAERIKEVNEKFQQELEHQKGKLDILKEEKNDLEMEYDDRLKQMEEKHRHELQEIENEYQHKVMYEVEKFQQLQQEKALQEKRCADQRGMLINTHERYVEELVCEFEKKLESETSVRSRLDKGNDEHKARAIEERKQLEEDIDSEIERLRHKYEGQLTEEREATLKYKGENGIMNKKFTVLQKEIEDQKEEIKGLMEKEKELLEQIKALQNEITTHKREIKSRDETIGEKEKRIYDLKKKNQELEKFKFVLDYKIKELKKQVEPREQEIANMKEQLKKMDSELEHYHKVNAGLDEKIGDMRCRLDELQEEIVMNRKRISHLQLVINNFKAGLADLVKLIQWPDKLKEGLESLHRLHVREVLPVKEVDEQVQNEYTRHREYLENTLRGLRNRYQREMEQHRKSNMLLMQDNLRLIKEIKRQREDNKGDRHALQAQIGVLQRNGIRKPLLTASSSMSGGLEDAGGLNNNNINNRWMEGVRSNTSASNDSVGEEEEREAAEALVRNKERIAQLRQVLVELEGRAVSVNKPYSKEVLPPMDA